MQLRFIKHRRKQHARKKKVEKKFNEEDKKRELIKGQHKAQGVTFKTNIK